MNAAHIVELFNALFEQKYNTVLCGGAGEPLYVPADSDLREPSRLYFRSDYPRSAFHEISHWCLAGPRRRKLADFGYVYTPPPRAPAEQIQFFELELKTQTLEFMFCEAVQLKFSPSADNLSVNHETITDFMQRINEKSASWKCSGVAGDAGLFLEKLPGLEKDC